MRRGRRPTVADGLMARPHAAHDRALLRDRTHRADGGARAAGRGHLMRGYVSDKDTIRIARQRPVWRWTDLQHAIRVDRGCSEATAQRAIKRAAHAGLLLHHDTSYQVTEDADRLLA